MERYNVYLTSVPVPSAPSLPLAGRIWAGGQPLLKFWSKEGGVRQKIVFLMIFRAFSRVSKWYLNYFCLRRYAQGLLYGFARDGQKESARVCVLLTL